MKNLIIILFAMLSSCNSFMFTSKEVLDTIYVKDKNGCSVQQGVAITTKKSISTAKLSFRFSTEKYLVIIPELYLNSGQANYSGLDVNHKKYLVRYVIEGKKTTIHISGNGMNIVVSNRDICSFNNS